MVSSYAVSSKIRALKEFRAIFQGIIFLTVLTLPGFCQHTYYISKSAGSDSNTAAQAQSKSTPWAHLPGMFSATGNAKAYTPVAGDQFILKGGDTWVNSDLGVTLFQSGTSANCALPYGSGATSSCIYIGVDQTWYAGSSWTRPTWDCGGSACASWGSAQSAFIYMGCKYCVVDNIEMKGFYLSNGGAQFVYADQEYVEARNIYAHGWSHAAGASSQLASFFNCATDADNCVGSMMDNNVIDGSDSSTQEMMWGTYGGGMERIFNNYYAYGPGFVSSWNFFYGNLVEYCTDSFDGNHGNCVFNGGPLSGNYVFQFNNIIRHTATTCPGCVKLWFMGQSAANSSLVGYAFNNVMYDNDPANIIDVTPSNGTGSSWGTYYFFDNSIECGNDSNTTNCTYGATGGHPFTLYMRQNHWITSASVCGPATCPNESGDLVETVAQANSNGYTSAQINAFSPTGSNSPTVGAGSNLQSYCSTLSGLDSVTGAACQNSTAYACSYETSNHTMTCPGRPTSARGTGAWDIGAYQYDAGNPPPNPPTGLSVVVN